MCKCQKFYLVWFKIQLLEFPHSFKYMYIWLWRGMYFMTFCLRQGYLHLFSLMLTSVKHIFSKKSLFSKSVDTLRVKTQFCLFLVVFFNDILYMRLYFWVVPHCLKVVHSVTSLIYHVTYMVNEWPNISIKKYSLSCYPSPTTSW